MQTFYLEFNGYTWDQYLYMIAEKNGIVITYYGCLDSEGQVKINRILSVDWVDRVGDFYESEEIQNYRANLPNAKMLFYSIAEVGKKDGILIAEHIRNYLSGEENIKKITIKCKGACALLPNSILEDL